MSLPETLLTFDAATLADLAAGQPAWRAEQMASALAAFDRQPTPIGTEEEWRYVDLGFDLADFEPATEPGDPMPPGPFLTDALGAAAGYVRIVDGRVTEVEGEGEVGVRRLAELDGISAAAPIDRDRFAAAHVAFATDGVRLEVPAGRTVPRPFVIDVQATQPGKAVYPHLEVAVGAEADLSVVAVFRSPDGVENVAAPGVTLDADSGGRLRYLAVQGWGQATTGVVHQTVTLGRDATGRLGEVGLGGRVARLDLGVELVGNGSSAEVVGLYFGEDHQTLDYRMVMTHRGKNTSSDVLLKGAVEDYAQSVFTGLIRIEKDAVRTSAFETNRNLVLSENAKAHSVPNLEILCDDVVCGHGSSVGPLEQDLLYYLQSRGLSRPRAEQMLIRGFFTEVIDRLPIATVNPAVSEAVFRRFVRAQEEGRLS